MTTAPPFVVRARKPHGTATYNCPTPEWALKKLSDFQAAGHDSISITGPDGQLLSEAELRALVAGQDSPVRSADRVTADLKS
ncbi:MULTISPECIES: hypothetical protein [unclassified Methylobacterium]|uniref:hypothetical protein n=1 Tax=unclassified Methylobacterium TaxID=2615210 RepID=UPI001FB87BE4|nr:MULTISPECIES: hypothetical protein [unclassified Methylobacterium]MCJ2091308.1 hypothetical protein [Methylobacterium sp. J-072]MCJ2143942.1 hypothetical protein [Methylobacterium sp. E-066]